MFVLHFFVYVTQFGRSSGTEDAQTAKIRSLLQLLEGKPDRQREVRVQTKETLHANQVRHETNDLCIIVLSAWIHS
jgi:hypothetical protein